MEIDSSRIQELIARPTESLAIELKRWIDPNSGAHSAIIVRTVLALRNYGSGYLVIGFDNDTLEPDKNNVPTNVKGPFHIDNI